MSTELTNWSTVDGVACLDPSSVASGRAALGYPPFTSYAISERGLKPTYARVVMRRADVAARFADRAFNHTLVWSDSSGRSMTFPRLGFHFAESAFDQFADDDDDPMIVTLTDIRRFWGMTNVDKRFNVLHPIMDGETYYESTLKTDGDEKRLWNWIEVIKNIWESVVGLSPALTFSTADVGVNVTAMTATDTPDADGRLLAQPRNLKFRGPFYGVMSWIAEHLHHEFIYDHQANVWSFVPFDPESPFISGASVDQEFQAFLNANVDRFGSLAGAGRTLPTPKPQYFNVPKDVVFKFPKANYDFNSGQANEDSDIGYQSLNKYLDMRVELVPSNGAAENGVRVLYDPMPAIYEPNGIQKEDSETRIEQHVAKRKKLLENEYDLTGTYNRLRLGGLPANLTYPNCNQSLMAMMVRHFPSSAVSFEVAQGSNRFGDFLLFYREYGADFFDFRKEWHNDLAWEPNEEYVAHHRAYVVLEDEDLPPNGSATAKVLRFVSTDGETEEDPDTYNITQTANLTLNLKNPWDGLGKRGLKLWAVLKRGYGWIPENPLLCSPAVVGVIKSLSGEVTLQSDGPLSAGYTRYALLGVNEYEVRNGVVCYGPTAGEPIRINICDCTEPCQSNHILDVIPAAWAFTTPWCFFTYKNDVGGGYSEIKDSSFNFKMTITGHSSWRGVFEPGITEWEELYPREEKSGTFAMPFVLGMRSGPDSSFGSIEARSGQFLTEYPQTVNRPNIYSGIDDYVAEVGPNGWKETATTRYLRRYSLVFRPLAGCQDLDQIHSNPECTLEEKELLQSAGLAWFDVPDSVDNPFTAPAPFGIDGPEECWDAGLLLGGSNSTLQGTTNTGQQYWVSPSQSATFIVLNFNKKRVWDTEDDKTNDTDNWCDVWEFGPPSDAIEAFTVGDAWDADSPILRPTTQELTALHAMMSYSVWLTTTLASEGNCEGDNTAYGPVGVDTPFDYSFFQNPLDVSVDPISRGYIGLTGSGGSWSRTVEAENGTSYTISLAPNDLELCLSGYGSGSGGGSICCTTMPYAADIQITCVLTLPDERRVEVSFNLEGGDEGEYVTTEILPVSEYTDREIYLFFSCQNGSIVIWAEDNLGNVFDMASTDDFTCEPFTVTFPTPIAIPDLNIAFSNLAIVQI